MRRLTLTQVKQRFRFQPLKVLLHDHPPSKHRCSDGSLGSDPFSFTARLKAEQNRRNKTLLLNYLVTMAAGRGRGLQAAGSSLF